MSMDNVSKRFCVKFRLEIRVGQSITFIWICLKHCIIELDMEMGQLTYRSFHLPPSSNFPCGNCTSSIFWYPEHWWSFKKAISIFSIIRKCSSHHEWISLCCLLKKKFAVPCEYRADNMPSHRSHLNNSSFHYWNEQSTIYLPNHVISDPLNTSVFKSLCKFFKRRNLR